jgi:hypothetical protein
MRRRGGEGTEGIDFDHIRSEVQRYSRQAVGALLIVLDYSARNVVDTVNLVR